MLIQQAYDVFGSGTADPLNPGRPTMVMEGLTRENSPLYTIEAQTDAPATAAMMRGPMMQALLEDRLKLKVHREKREGPVFIMTLAKGRQKLQPTREGTCEVLDYSESFNMKDSGQRFCAVPKIVRNGPVTILDAPGITLGALANLFNIEGRKVIDQTGLKGQFDIHVEWESESRDQSAIIGGVARDPSPHRSAVGALREQLGLQLDPGRGTIETSLSTTSKRLPGID